MKVERPSAPEDRDGITKLVSRNLGLPADSPATNPTFQDWKYWRPHPFFAASRGCVWYDDGRLCSHGCRWPIRLQTESGDFDCFHMIDWVADRSYAGAGLSVLRACSEGLSAVFAIGGSPAGQKMTAAFGFRPKNQIWLLRRPLRLWTSTCDEGSIDWKTPVRRIRDSFRSVYPAESIEQGWHYESITPAGTAETLFPRAQQNQAASRRDPVLLQHIAACPLFKKIQTYCLMNGSVPAAYFVLAQVQSEVRLIDFGPAGLTGQNARWLGACAQMAAHADFPHAQVMATATTEAAVRDGFVRSGLRNHTQKTVRVLALNSAIRAIENFRLTMVDWDACCL